MRYRCRFLTIVLAIATSSSAIANGVQLSEPEFRAKYLEAVQQSLAIPRNLKATGLLQRSGYTAEIEFLVANDSMQLWTHYPDDRSSQPAIRNYPALNVRSYSPAQVFTLACNTLGDDFYITAVGETARQEIAHYLAKFASPCCMAATHIPGYTIAELLNDVRTRVTGIRGEGHLAVVDLDWSQRRDPQAGGTFWFNPEIGWRIDRYELRSRVINGAVSTHHAQIEYSSVDHICKWFPKNVRIEYANADGTRDIAIAWSLKTVVFDQIDDTAFTLESFGLGNRDLTAAEGASLPWMLIISAVIFVASGGYLYCRRSPTA